MIRSKVSAFFSESDVDVGEVAGFAISGAGRFWGLSVTHLFPRRAGYSHDLTLGFQDRFFESDVTSPFFSQFFSSTFIRADGLPDNVKSRPQPADHAGLPGHV